MHREDTKKSASPKSLNIKLGTYSAFDIYTSSPENNELEIRTTQAKDRTKVYRDSKGIRRSDTVSSNSGKWIRTGKHFINAYRGTAQHNIENNTSSEAQASINTALLQYDGPDFITNTETPRPLPKTTQYNI